MLVSSFCLKNADNTALQQFKAALQQLSRNVKLPAKPGGFAWFGPYTPKPGLRYWAHRIKENGMGFFSKILEKLGIGDAKAAPAPEQGTAASAAAPGAAPAAAPVGGSAAPSAAIPVTDVVAQLEQKAAANPQKLNWRTSIVDLLKLLDLDSSLAARKELATELGCPPELMSDSAQMNMWLHKTVLARIAQNGGNIPQDLLN